MSTTTTTSKPQHSAPARPQQKEEREREEQRPVSQTTATATEEEEEVQPDERDRAELEAAREQDSQRQDTNSSEEEEVPEEPEEEPEEIVALRAAFQRVQDKIDWHAQEIEKHNEAVRNHEQQIDDLKEMLRTKFGGLVGTISSGNGSRGPGRPMGNQQRKPQQQSSQQGSRARTNYGSGSSTGDLIAACLKKARKPVNTETLVKFLEDHGNQTNPSVELSRMVKKELVGRPSRGFYEWIGPND